MNDPENVATTAAIAGGFGMLGLLIIMFSVITLLHRVAGKKLAAATRQAKPTSARDGALYSGLVPQSTMGLMSSTSGQSFASSPSELFKLDKCVSGSVVEFHREQQPQPQQQLDRTEQKNPSAAAAAAVATVAAVVERSSGHVNRAMALDEVRERDSNSDEGEDGYGPIQITKTEKQDSSAC